MPEFSRTLGAIPDPPDKRDYVYRGAPAAALVKRGVHRLPTAADNSHKCLWTWNQGQDPVCVGMAVAGAASAEYGVELSARWIYHYASMHYNGVPGDPGGTTPRAGLRAWYKRGVPQAGYWPFIPLDRATLPNAGAMANADLHPLGSYTRLDGLNETLHAIAGGKVVVLTYKVHELWDRPKPDEIIRWRPGIEFCGHHAVVGAGYDNNARAILVHNSWGPGWCKNGNGRVSYEDYRFVASAWLPTIGPKPSKWEWLHNMQQWLLTRFRAWGNGQV